MKVKNIVFSGFAAAVLMGIAADASAEVQVATKAYVEDYVGTLDNEVSADEGKYVTGVTQTNGKVVSVATTGFDTTIDANATDDNAPTSKAVYDYVAANDTTYTSADAYITVDNTNDKIGLTNITDGSITDGSTALTTANAVYDYVAANDANTTYTAGSHITITGDDNSIAVNDVTSAGQDIGLGDTGLTTGNAVYEYVTGAVEASEYTAGNTYITVDNDNNKIELSNYTDTTITDGSTALTTANAVYDYVTQLTGGVLPDGCETGDCSLVKRNGTLQWVNLTIPVE